MLRSIHSLRWAALSLCASSLLAACGGGPDGAAGGGAAPAPPTTLSVTSELALQVSGNARSLTVTNTGSAPALSVIYSVNSAPLGTITTTVSDCSTLAPGAVCTITVTPGATASATAGNTSPVPITFNVGGVNTNIVSASVHVLEFGSVYQSGYVFAFDDTTPATGSVGGKVVARTDASPGLIWSSNGNGGAPGDVANNVVPGIDETSTPVMGICNGGTDGACNTREITTFYNGVNTAYFAAGVCRATMSGYSDWFLPSVCELGGDAFAGCGVGVDSVQKNLIDNNALLVADQPQMTYWSSTQYSATPATQAWAHHFASGGGDFSGQSVKDSLFPVRCVRSLTL